MRKIAGWIIGALLSLAWAPGALAAFPGANGLLAVQPRFGSGIVLVGADGHGARRICAHCAATGPPSWSPDGRALVFAAPTIRIVYPDGTCMNCQFGPAAAPAFEGSGTVVSFVLGGRLTVDGIDGNREPSPLSGEIGQAAWAAGGKLAIVRRGVIWAGTLQHLRRLAPGTQVSWAPGGETIAAVKHGWIALVRVRDARVRLLVRGSAPAFSPDGRWIAFVGPGHRLMVLAVVGAHPVARAVGHIQAMSVDWQPRPRARNPGCAAPPGSSVLASSPAAVVTQDGPVPPAGTDFGVSPALSYMGCLRANGRERLLDRFSYNNIDNATWAGSAVIAAPYAALVETNEDIHYGGQTQTVRVFDLRTGSLVPSLGGETISCPGYGFTAPCPAIDQSLLGRDGVSAVHVEGQVISTPCSQASPCSSEQILTSDSTGVHTVDSLQLPGDGPFLTGLTLTGDTVTWSHDGSPRSVVLTPRR